MAFYRKNFIFVTIFVNRLDTNIYYRVGFTIRRVENICSLKALVERKSDFYQSRIEEGLFYASKNVPFWSLADILLHTF